MTKRAHIGMAMFLISEAVFFLMLILACAYFRAVPRLIAPPGWLLTALPLATAFTIWRGWRWITVALGAAFLVGIIGEISVLTAVLGLFVFAGVIALALVPVSGLRTMALYWYFLTAVWLVILVVASQT